MRALTLWCVLAAAAAPAQSRPTLVDHPLEVKSGLSSAQLSKLQEDFRLLLARRSGVLVPTRTGWKMATSALNRQDCDVRDDCLRQLAVTGGTLYALYAQVESNAAGTEAVATGRVVSQDGAAVRAAQRVAVPVKGAFTEAAKKALDGLLDALELEQLPPVLSAPAAAVAQAPPAPGAEAPPLPPPPPPPPLDPKGEDVPHLSAQPSPGNPGLRAAAIVTTGAAAVAAAVALGFGVSAASERAALPSDGRLADEAQVQRQALVNRNASVALGVGVGAGALAVTGIILFAVSAPQQRPRVAVAPTAGGAALVVGGGF